MGREVKKGGDGDNSEEPGFQDPRGERDSDGKTEAEQEERPFRSAKGLFNKEDIYKRPSGLFQRSYAAKS